MGAWSIRIFDDDGAADIRDEYRILLGYGISPQEAYQKIEAYFLKDYHGEDDEDVYWLSVALYQWENGILMDNVKQKALECIENESYLERWKESGEKTYHKRKRALEEFKGKLINEVKPMREKFPKCPKEFRYKTNWKVGDLLAYQIKTNVHEWPNNEIGKRISWAEKKIWQKYVLLRVVEINKSPVSFLCPELDYTSSATVMLYDWWGNEIPSESEISQLNFRKIVNDYWPSIKQVVSGVTLDMANEKKDNCVITVLGNDKGFCEDIPALYIENSKCPIEIPIHFNISLAMTFALKDDDLTEWHYH